MVPLSFCDAADPQPHEDALPEDGSALVASPAASARFVVNLAQSVRVRIALVLPLIGSPSYPPEQLFVLSSGAIFRGSATGDAPRIRLPYVTLLGDMRVELARGISLDSTAKLPDGLSVRGDLVVFDGFDGRLSQDLSVSGKIKLSARHSQLHRDGLFPVPKDARVKLQPAAA